MFMFACGIGRTTCFYKTTQNKRKNKMNTLILIAVYIVKPVLIATCVASCVGAGVVIWRSSK